MKGKSPDSSHEMDVEMVKTWALLQFIRSRKTSDENTEKVAEKQKSSQIMDFGGF